MTVCSKCRIEHDRPGRYCGPCKAAYMREWRKTHPMNDGQRRRDASRSHANVYKKRGKIERKPCFVCQSQNSEMHHPDHELPLLVAWLCRECHLDWHAHWRFTSLRTWNRWLQESKNVRCETISPSLAEAQ